jgi:sarcosine oxidase subunit gamma
MPEPIVLTSRSGFAGLLEALGPAPEPGVRVSEPADLQIATLIARRGERDGFGERLRTAYGLELPSGPKRVASDRLALLGTGPRTWLALRTGGAPLALELARELGDTAAVADQTDGYAVLRLTGETLRATFEKGLAVDLHPRAFRPGDVAVTTCAHLGVIVWQLDDAPTYEVAVFRSLAASFWHWLCESAAEFGLGAIPAGRG